MRSITRRGLIYTALAVALSILLSLHRLPLRSSLPPSTAQFMQSTSDTSQEAWSLLIDRYAIHHQGNHTLTITADCTYKVNQTHINPPDASRVYSQIDRFLASYPNNHDYWEIVNRKLTGYLLSQNAAIDSVTVSLKVLPTPDEPFTRTTTVTHTNSGEMQESWSFITAQLTVPHHGNNTLNITVKYLYANGIADSQYPDFVPIYYQIAQFLKTYPSDTDAWEVVNHRLVDRVIQAYPTMISFTSNLEVLPSQTLPYHFYTAVTRTRSHPDGSMPKSSL